MRVFYKVKFSKLFVRDRSPIQSARVDDDSLNSGRKIYSHTARRQREANNIIDSPRLEAIRLNSEQLARFVHGEYAEYQRMF